MLSEQQVAKSWRRLFQPGDYTEKSFERAEALLESLRMESPLRHRLSQELDELREIHSDKSSAAADVASAAGR